MEIKLTEHQQEIYNNVLQEIKDCVNEEAFTNNIISLNGAAGTGKTTLQAKLIEECVSLGYKVHLATPTHKALHVAKSFINDKGLEIGTSTIHSFLKLKLKPDFNTGIQNLVKDYSNKEKVKKIDLLIVDESSMISAELFKFITKHVKGKNAKCVLFVGDKNQLSPVDGEANPVFDLRCQYKLTEVLRQALDSPILSLATEIRGLIENETKVTVGALFSNVKEQLKKNPSEQMKVLDDGSDFMREYFSHEGEDKIIAAFTNRTVNSFNAAIRKKLKPDAKYLEPGDKIVLQQPNRAGEVSIHSNGDEIRLVSCELKEDSTTNLKFWSCTDEYNKKINIIDPESERLYKAGLDHLSNKAKSADKTSRAYIWKEFFELQARYVDIKYSYASSIHKLQGSTFSSVFIDFREMHNMPFDKDTLRLVYVALTRASEKVCVLI